VAITVIRHQVTSGQSVNQCQSTQAVRLSIHPFITHYYFDPPEPDDSSTGGDSPCGMFDRKIVKTTRILPHRRRNFVRKQDKLSE
jgi:hypothetical protein